ncbi:MAG: M15 family metallopeptidase [Saprospiraceae bacterium]|nr:M15 family metallopeptidase [Saprospiraceae bacterium]
MKYWFLLLLMLSFYTCTNKTISDTTISKTIAIDTIVSDTSFDRFQTNKAVFVGFSKHEVDSLFKLDDSSWVDMRQLIPDLEIDLRYATTNNFMELQIYNCPKCYLRMRVAKAVMQIQNKLKEQNLGLKVFDCYRPQSAQYKLWKKKSDPRFVTPPSKGSMHSRGGAMDLTIVDLNTGKELEMGTGYDYFGREAYWGYNNLSAEILENRQLLLNTMEAFGFKTVTTEWWHFSYRRAWFKLSDMKWECN